MFIPGEVAKATEESAYWHRSYWIIKEETKEYRSVMAKKIMQVELPSYSEKIEKTPSRTKFLDIDHDPLIPKIKAMKTPEKIYSDFKIEKIRSPDRGYLDLKLSEVFIQLVI
jgi:hypothetical protein